MTILETKDLRKFYGSGDTQVKALDGVDLSVENGEFVAIVGTSGSGKSTLLHMLGGLDRPTSGAVLVDGKDIFSLKDEELTIFRRRKIGFVFQSPYLFQALTARENLVFARKAAGARVDEERVDAALERFGLADRADHLPCELSVGQKRRLVVARALLAGHEVILADEPTNDLDGAWSDCVFRHFREFAEEGSRAVVVVTHDETYARLADAVYELDGGALHRR